MRELGSGTTCNTHNTTSLIRTLKYVPDILQTEEAFTVKEYTHTHTHVISKDYVQKINDTTIYAEKMYYRNFTYLGKKFMLSLHYNGDDSYLFVNGRQELKFKTKTDQLVKEKLCVGNLSDQWTTTSESEKTGTYGKIYDFVVDYEQIVGTIKILDMHKYLMTKHNISP